MVKKIFSSLISRPEIVCWTLLWLMTAVVLCRPVETGDIWWHLKVGQFIAENKVVPLFDPFPIVGEKVLWVLTQWLGSLTYFLVYDAAGLLGLKLFRILVVLIALWQLKRFTKESQIAAFWTPLLGLLFVLAVSSRPHLRPFLFNIVYIQIFMGSLLHFYRKRRVITLLPAIFVAPLWVNTHMGSFVYGFALVGMLILASLIEARTHKQSLKGFWILLGFASIYALCFMANPYGLQGALHPLRTLFDSEYLNFGLIKSSISELQPPALLSWSYLWFYPVAFLGGASIFLDSHHRFRNAILFAVALFMFLYGQRAGLFFTLVSIYLFIDSQRTTERPLTLPPHMTRWILLPLLGLCMVVIGHNHWKQKVFLDGKIHRQMFMSQAYTTPIKLFEKLKWEEVNGIIFNEDSYGGYMYWHVYPQMQPFADTRQIHIRNFELYNLVLHDPSRYWSYADLNYRFKTVILTANKAMNWRLIRHLQKQDSWYLTDVIGDQVVFRRNKKESISQLHNSLLSLDQAIPELKRSLAKILAQGPRHRVTFLHMEPANTAMTLFELGYAGAALQQLNYSFEISNSSYQHEIAQLILNHL